MSLIVGIYKIECNNRIYIGSSINILKRWKDHRNSLCRNKHLNPKLQNAWNKYGEDAFKFSIVEEVADKEDLIRIEQIWLDILFTALEKDEIFNLAIKADSPMRGRKHSEITKEKLSLVNKGRIQTEEHKRKVGLTKIGNKYVLGKHPTESTIKKIIESQAKQYSVINPDGDKITFIGLNQFCKKYNLQPSKLSLVLNGKRNHHKGYTKS